MGSFTGHKNQARQQFVKLIQETWNELSVPEILILGFESVDDDVKRFVRKLTKLGNLTIVEKKSSRRKMLEKEFGSLNVHIHGGNMWNVLLNRFNKASRKENESKTPNYLWCDLYGAIPKKVSAEYHGYSTTWMFRFIDYVLITTNASSRKTSDPIVSKSVPMKYRQERLEHWFKGNGFKIVPGFREYRSRRNVLMLQTCVTWGDR